MHCFFYCLDFYITTAPKIFAISSRTDKNSCRNFARLSACCLHGKTNSTIFTYHALIPCFFCLVFYITTAPKIFAISSRTGKNSCHNFARLSACCLHGKINSTILSKQCSMHCFFYCLDFYITTAPKIFAISSHTDKNSCRNFARLSACCSGFAFRNYSLLIIHYSLKSTHLSVLFIVAMCSIFLQTSL